MVYWANTHTPRCKDLSAQNNLLHQHLESVSSQAARIRQAADSSATPAAGDVDSTEDVDTKLSELRSVVTYLRKEKEIVDLQLELSKQENARLRTQMEHLNQSLEEARKTLSEVSALLVDILKVANIYRNENVQLKLQRPMLSMRSSWKESISSPFSARAMLRSVLIVRPRRSALASWMRNCSNFRRNLNLLRSSFGWPRQNWKLATSK